ncbi:hypothetical protein CL638_02675 [bacterium]|nr:hypothetical protein [bacterium]
MDTKQLDEQVEKILTTTTVSKAQEIMASRNGQWLIAFISFLESATPVPIMTDPFMMASIILNRAKYLQTILVTTIASVAGGVLAYFTAVFFLELALNWLAPDAAFALASMTATEQDNIFLLSLVGAFTPVPYTLTAWTVGVMQGSLTAFIIASIIGRGARYLIIGWLTYHFGPAAVKIARRYVGITSIVIILLAGAFMWYKLSA